MWNIDVRKKKLKDTKKEEEQKTRAEGMFRKFQLSIMKAGWQMIKKMSHLRALLCTQGYKKLIYN